MSQAYETMYILRPDLSEENLDQAINQYQTMLGNLGAVDVQTQHRGKRRLAYEIQRYREGIYIQMNYKAAAKAVDVATLERAMRLSDDVIRYLTIKQEVDDQVAEPVSA